jgi:hypothetical protein
MGKKTSGGGHHTTKPEATLASKVLSGAIKNPTKAQVLSLAATALSDAKKK